VQINEGCYNKVTLYCTWKQINYNSVIEYCLNNKDLILTALPAGREQFTTFT
jgi:hypothetical protein